MEDTNQNDTIIGLSEAAKMLNVTKESVRLWIESDVSQIWSTSKNDREVYKDPKDGSIRRRKVSNPLILIVEDDVTMQSYYQVIFEFLLDKPNLEFAINGLEGLRKIKELKPKLLITDISMPGMDGLEMLDMLNDSDSTQSMQTVFITGLSKKQIKDNHSIPEDIDCYNKPLNIDDVKLILHNANIKN